MFKTLFKISFRNLIKHKSYSITNILGLTLGFTAFILVAVFIHFELSWDSHNLNYNRLYRVQRYMANAKYAMNGNNISPHTRAITASLLEANYPDFEKVSVIRETGGKYLSSDSEHLIYDITGIHADENFFSLFTYQFLSGNVDSALHSPFSIVLSESLAMKLFGSTNVISKTVFLEKKYPYKVTGVFADRPRNSSVRPEFIISFNTLAITDNIKRTDIWTGDCMTFALLKPNTNVEQLQAKIGHVFDNYKDSEFEELQLCPISKVYLNFNDRNDYLIVLKLFGLIALFILLMSVFNYVNLSVAKSSLRGKEVAIKKVMGSNKRILLLQFLGETILLSFVALCLAWLVVQLVLPLFSDIIDKPLSAQILYQWPFLLFLVLMMVSVGFLSGIYPALFLSSKKITSLLKGTFFNQVGSAVNLKKILVAFQFGIALFLIFLTLSISLQIKYLTTKNLGFKKEGVLYAQMNVSRSGVSFSQLRARMLQNSNIKEACMSRNLPFVRYGGGSTNWEGCEPGEQINCRFNDVGYDYLNTIGATIVKGRDFSRNYPGDVGIACVINESAAKCFGWDNPIGKHLKDNRYTVVGVVRNFIYKDMHNGIEPNIMVLAPDDTKGDWIFSFRTDNENLSSAKEFINQELTFAFPDDPFDLHNLPLAFENENSYKTYHSVNHTILFFTIINIILAVMGLLGLVSFTISRRRKEIGIRKINGSTISQLFYLLTKEYFILLLIALVGGLPLAWWVYEAIPGANKLSVQPWIFVVGLIVLLIVVFISSGYQTYKAATRNPVEALRYE